MGFTKVKKVKKVVCSLLLKCKAIVNENNVDILSLCWHSKTLTYRVSLSVDVLLNNHPQDRSKVVLIANVT